MKISKPFVVATEGQTIDDRTISKELIMQMAAHYEPKVYTAVANLEHFLSAAPDSLFSAYGKVLSLTTQEATLLGDKKLQLLAVVEADDAVVAMQKAGKKLFASMEVKANFLGKGFAYLTGLAFTDKPASIGTESMKFSAGKDSIYSFSHEIDIEFEDAEQQQTQGTSLLSRVKEMLSFKGKTDEARFTDIGQAVEAVALSQKELLEKFSTATADLAAANEKLTAAAVETEKDRAEFAKLKAEVDTLSAQPNGQVQRPAASGGAGALKTDC